jgi:FAD:protein FMN transferase
MRAPADLTFHSMGSDIRLIVDAPLLGQAALPAQAVARERAYIEHFAACLSRFRPGSELSALNADPRALVPASALLRTAVRAALWAAERSGGLVDPTLIDELEAAGYQASRDGDEPASLHDALAAAPARRAAGPRRRARWREIAVDDDTGIVRRPPGVRIDTGGTGKGLAADAVAYRLGRYSRVVVDCGGDIAVSGVAAQLEPVAIGVEHPLTSETVARIALRGGGIATSGLNVRIWRGEQGTFAHHLIDPATGEPVWSGLIAATALAPSALEAETLSKLALLTGPDGARRALREHGGLVVHDDGDVELVGPVEQADAGAASPARAA